MNQSHIIIFVLLRSTSKGNNQCIYSRNLHISLQINSTFFLSHMNVMKQSQIYCKLSWSKRLEHITSHINHKVWTIRINISIRDYNTILCILYIWLTQFNTCVPSEDCTLHANTCMRSHLTCRLLFEHLFEQKSKHPNMRRNRFI